jgi:oligopeptidase A
VGQDKALYQALKAIDPQALPQDQRRALTLALQDFEMSGVALEGQAAQDFVANRIEMGRLSTEFSNAVLDATEGWTLEIIDEARLAGIPDADRAGMQAAAQRAGKEGWLVTLHAPSVMAVLSHAEARLREEAYRAWNTRASDQGPNAGQFDNGPRIAEILRAEVRLHWRWGLKIRWRSRSRPRWRGMGQRLTNSSPALARRRGSGGA